MAEAKVKENKLKADQEIRMAEIRAVNIGEDGEMRIEGYAIVFDEPATHYGFTEIIDKKALDKTDMKDVPLRYNHNDNNFIMARTRNKSLKLIVDDKGLLIRATLLDTQSNRDLYKSIEEGLIDKMSFMFSINGEDGAVWDYDTNTRVVMDIKKLFDVSVVDTPFYEGTSINARSYARALSELDNHKMTLENVQTEARKLELEKEKLKLRSQM